MVGHRCPECNIFIQEGFGAHAKVKDRYKALAVHYSSGCDFCKISAELIKRCLAYRTHRNSDNRGQRGNRGLVLQSNKYHDS